MTVSSHITSYLVRKNSKFVAQTPRNMNLDRRNGQTIIR